MPTALCAMLAVHLQVFIGSFRGRAGGKVNLKADRRPPNSMQSSLHSNQTAWEASEGPASAGAGSAAGEAEACSGPQLNANLLKAMSVELTGGALHEVSEGVGDHEALPGGTVELNLQDSDDLSSGLRDGNDRMEADDSDASLSDVDLPRTVLGQQGQRQSAVGLIVPRPVQQPSRHRARTPLKRKRSPTAHPDSRPAVRASATPAAAQVLSQQQQSGSISVGAAAPTAALGAGVAEEGSPGCALEQAKRKAGPAQAAAGRRLKPRTSRASSCTANVISKAGHTIRGRVRQKSHKNAELLNAGSLRSSVSVEQLCVHDCEIIGHGGIYSPLPTFRVTARDRPEEPFLGKSATGCWTGILQRINDEIEARRQAGDDLPPPPKTALAGPEYFGLNQVEVQQAVEALDPEHLCREYWAGKAAREAAAAGLPLPERPAQAAAVPQAVRGHSDEEQQDPAGCADGLSSKWSAVTRTQRYRQRCGDAGREVDASNPLPHLIDPITLEPVVTPAISPYGHVMGMATWKAVLAEQRQCPFTKAPLSWEQCTVLTHGNFERYKHRIKPFQVLQDSLAFTESADHDGLKGISTGFPEPPEANAIPFLWIALCCKWHAHLLQTGNLYAVSQFLCNASKSLSGTLADFLSPARMVIFGTLLTTINKPMFAMSGYVYASFGTVACLYWVTAGKVFDRWQCCFRMSKGIREAPGKALIGDLAREAGDRTEGAFSLRQSMATFGALLGSAIAGLAFRLSGSNYILTFALSAIPASAALLLVTTAFGKGATAADAANKKKRKDAADKAAADGIEELSLGQKAKAFLKALQPAYWQALAVVSLLYFARFDASFITLRARTVMAKSQLPLVTSMMMVTQAVLATPVGLRAKRSIGARNGLLLLGFGAMISADLVFALTNNAAGMFVGAALVGVHMAMTHGICLSMISAYIPAGEIPGLGRVSGTVWSFTDFVLGVVLAYSNSLAGKLTDLSLKAGYGNTGCFYGGAAATVLSGIVLLVAANFLDLGREDLLIAKKG
eukprot:jgi/Astpho2/8342/fgenesh1_pg.00122_%23_79_t